MGQPAGRSCDEAEYDEHIWLSPQNAAALTAAIADALAKARPAQADRFRQNAALYREKLAALDEAYRRTIDAGRYRTLLFADRFPFRYLTAEYGLRYYAAFAGCSAETGASVQTIAFLAEKMRVLRLPAVLVLESGDTRLADTILGSVPDAAAKVLVMDSMQSVTARDADRGASYLDIMEKNRRVLAQALQAAGKS